MSLHQVNSQNIGHILFFKTLFTSIYVICSYGWQEYTWNKTWTWKTIIKTDHFRNNFLHLIILLPYYRVLVGFWDPMKLFFHPRVWLTLNWICPSHFRSVDSTYISSFKYIQSNLGNTATNQQWVKKIWPYYCGRLKSHDVRSVMANTPYTPILNNYSR